MLIPGADIPRLPLAFSAFNLTRTMLLRQAGAAKTAERRWSTNAGRFLQRRWHAIRFAYAHTSVTLLPLPCTPTYYQTSPRWNTAARDGGLLRLVKGCRLTA